MPQSFNSRDSNAFAAQVTSPANGRKPLPYGYSDNLIWIRLKIGREGDSKWVGPFDNDLFGLNLARQWAKHYFEQYSFPLTQRVSSHTWLITICRRVWSPHAHRWGIIVLDTITPETYREGLRSGAGITVKLQLANRPKDTPLLDNTFHGYWPEDYENVPQNPAPVNWFAGRVIYPQGYDANGVPLNSQNFTGSFVTREGQIFLASIATPFNDPNPLMSFLETDQNSRTDLLWEYALDGYAPGTNLQVSVPTIPGEIMQGVQVQPDFIRQPGDINASLFGTSFCHIAVERPVTNLLDDDGISQGTFLAGFTAEYVTITRITEEVFEERSDPNYRMNAPGRRVSSFPVVTFPAGTFAPVLGARPFFKFGFPESIMLAPLMGTYIRQYTSDTDGNLTPGEVLYEYTTVPPFDSRPSVFLAFDDTTGTETLITNATRYCQTKYRIRAVYVTRGGGSETFAHSPPLIVEVCAFSNTIEPYLSNATITADMPELLNYADANIVLKEGYDVDTNGALIAYDTFQFEVDIPPGHTYSAGLLEVAWAKFAPRDAQSIPNIDHDTSELQPSPDFVTIFFNILGGGEYYRSLVFQHWQTADAGLYADIGFPFTLDNPPTVTDYTSWSYNLNGTQMQLEQHGQKKTYNITINDNGTMEHIQKVRRIGGLVTITMFACYAAFSNGGSVNYEYPRYAKNQVLAQPAASLDIGPFFHSLGDYGPQGIIQFGPSPPPVKKTYYKGTITLWIVQDGKPDAGNINNPLGNFSEDYRLTLADGRRAYYAVGEQYVATTNVAVLYDTPRGFFVVGWDNILFVPPTDTTSGFTSYSGPHFAQGPYTYYINADQTVTFSQPLVSNEKTDVTPGPVLNADAAFGSVTVRTPSGDQLLTIYSRPQKKP